MPYVNIKITREPKTTGEQKRKLIAGVTELLRTELGKDPRMTFIVIDEVDIEDWGVAGMTVKEFRGTETRD